MRILSQFDGDFPGVIIGIQEIHPTILAPFCSCFDRVTSMEVRPVTGPCVLEAGRVYLASTQTGLSIERSEAGHLEIRPTGSTTTPIDQLFSSAARVFGPNTCGILLSGLGVDGADGMRQIKDRGGITIAQDLDYCAFPSLTENALQQGVVDMVLSGSGMALYLESWAKEK